MRVGVRVGMVVGDLVVGFRLGIAVGAIEKGIRLGELVGLNVGDKDVGVAVCG